MGTTDVVGVKGGVAGIIVSVMTGETVVVGIEVEKVGAVTDAAGIV